MLIQVPAATKVIGLIMVAFMSISGLISIDRHDVIVRKDKSKNCTTYEIITNEKGKIYEVTVVEYIEESGSWFDCPDVIIKDKSTTKEWVETGFGHETSWGDFYKKLASDEKVNIDRLIDFLGRDYEVVKRDLDKQALKTRVNERWFNK